MDELLLSVCVNNLAQRQIDQNALRYYARCGYLDEIVRISYNTRHPFPVCTYVKRQKRGTNLRRMNGWHADRRCRVRIAITAYKRLSLQENLKDIKHDHEFQNRPLPSVHECWRLYSPFLVSICFDRSGRYFRAIDKTTVLISHAASFMSSPSRTPLNAGNLGFFHVLSWFDRLDRMLFWKNVFNLKAVKYFLIHIVEFL
jgi:hypothetical protein